MALSCRRSLQACAVFLSSVFSGQAPETTFEESSQAPISVQPPDASAPARRRPGDGSFLRARSCPQSAARAARLGARRAARAARAGTAPARRARSPFFFVRFGFSSEAAEPAECKTLYRMSNTLIHFIEKQTPLRIYITENQTTLLC